MAFTFGRIDEAIAAHPDVVIRFRELGNNVAALIVGDDDLAISGGQIFRFRDHPYARFGALRAGDHAADIVGDDFNFRGGFSCRASRARDSEYCGETDCHDSEIRHSFVHRLISFGGWAKARASSIEDWDAHPEHELKAVRNRMPNRNHCQSRVPRDRQLCKEAAEKVRLSF